MSVIGPSHRGMRLSRAELRRHTNVLGRHGRAWAGRVGYPTSRAGRGHHARAGLGRHVGGIGPSHRQIRPSHGIIAPSHQKIRPSHAKYAMAEPELGRHIGVIGPSHRQMRLSRAELRRHTSVLGRHSSVAGWSRGLTDQSRGKGPPCQSRIGLSRRRRRAVTPRIRPSYGHWTFGRRGETAPRARVHGIAARAHGPRAGATTSVADRPGTIITDQARRRTESEAW